MLFSFKRLFFEMHHLEGRRTDENGKANVVESLVEAVKQRSIKHAKNEKEKNKVFSFFSASPFSYLFNHVFPFSRQTKKVKRERAHKTPIHKIKPIPNFILGKLFAWRVLEVLCGHEDRLFFIFSSFLPFRALDVLQEAISLPFHPLDVMCYSYRELLSQNIIIKQMDIYIIRW